MIYIFLQTTWVAGPQKWRVALYCRPTIEEAASFIATVIRQNKHRRDCEFFVCRDVENFARGEHTLFDYVSSGGVEVYDKDDGFKREFAAAVADFLRCAQD